MRPIKVRKVGASGTKGVGEGIGGGGMRAWRWRDWCGCWHWIAEVGDGGWCCVGLSAAALRRRGRLMIIVGNDLEDKV